MLFHPNEKGQNLLLFVIIMALIAAGLVAFVFWVVVPSLPYIMESNAPETIKEIAKAIYEAIGAGN